MISFDEYIHESEPHETCHEGCRLFRTFFRNLLLGESNELRNRHMIVNVPENFSWTRTKHYDRTSYRTSSRFVINPFKRTVIIKTIDGEDWIETSSDFFNELYKPRYHSWVYQNIISRKPQSSKTEISVD